MKITFTDTIGIDEKYSVVPATKTTPSWYKNTNSYFGLTMEINDGVVNETIKKCMPVFDAMTAGYIIKTYVDVYVTQVNDLPYYQWPSFEPIDFHLNDQAPLHPNYKNAPYPKWISPWSIKTTPGYSCLFVSPMHHENKIFTILPGIVDTDKYISPVSFPFTLNNIQWTGLIPAGTPIAQVIPFKRDSFKMEFGNHNNIKEINKNVVGLRSLIFNSYKKQFWSKKIYR